MTSYAEIKSRNTKFLGQMQDELKFLKWKAEVYADSVQPGDAIIIGLNDASKLFELSRKACHYTKVSIKQFTEFVWQESVTNGGPLHERRYCDIVRHVRTKIRLTMLRTTL